MDRRAVVTGGAGFLGSHLCDRLVKDRWEVLCLDNLLTGLAENVSHLVHCPGFTMLRCDVSEHFRISGPVDLVLHFASPASPADYLHLPMETLKVGSIGTLNALRLAEEKSARFVLASTSEIYGDPLIHPQPESYWGNVNPLGPRGVYDEAKRFSEALTTAYRTTCGLNTAIVRLFNTFGPRLRPTDGRAIPTFIRQALSGEALTVTGDGRQTRSICYVDDIVDGVVRMASTNHPGPVNLGNPHELSMVDLARWIKELSKSDSTLTFIDRAQDDPRKRRPDISLARDVLGWEPKVDVHDGLVRTIKWAASKHGGSHQ